MLAQRGNFADPPATPGTLQFAVPALASYPQTQGLVLLVDLAAIDNPGQATLNGVPKERPQTELPLDMCVPEPWVLLAMPLCRQVPLEKCQSIAAKNFLCPFTVARSQEDANRR